MFSILSKYKKKYLYIILFFILISHNTNFFHNIYTIVKFSPEERMETSYGYCGDESYGFINEIYQNNKIDINFLILNDNPNFTFNNSIWFFYKINKSTSNNNVILLNNKNSLEFLDQNYAKLKFKNTEYGKYKIIKSFNNCYFLKK